jgi:hypothetical protein
MSLKTAYLGLSALGTVLPYSALLPFLRDHGLDASLFIAQMFETPIAAFFSWDVLLSSAVLWTLVLVEGRREHVPYLWAPLAGNVAVGVSLGLPLFLYLRERKREEVAR